MAFLHTDELEFEDMSSMTNSLVLYYPAHSFTTQNVSDKQKQQMLGVFFLKNNWSLLGFAKAFSFFFLCCLPMPFCLKHVYLKLKAKKTQFSLHINMANKNNKEDIPHAYRGHKLA